MNTLLLQSRNAQGAMEPRSKEGKHFLRRLVEHFDKSCVRLAMDEPTVFIPLLSSPSLPSPKALRTHSKKTFLLLWPLCPISSSVSFSPSTPCLSRKETSCSVVFSSPRTTGNSDVYSLGFYRLRAKAIRFLCHPSRFSWFFAPLTPNKG